MQLIEKLTKIADAIRGKTGSTEKMTLDQMETAIQGIESGSEPMVLFVRVIDSTGLFKTSPLVLVHRSLKLDVRSSDSAPTRLNKAEKLSTIVHGLGLANLTGLVDQTSTVVGRLIFSWQYYQEDMTLIVTAGR